MEFKERMRHFARGVPTEEYREHLRGLGEEELRYTHQQMLRRRFAGGTAIVTGLASAVPSCGISLGSSLIGMQRVNVNSDRIKLVEEQLAEKGWQGHKMGTSDYMLPITMGVVGLGIVAGVDVAFDVFGSGFDSAAGGVSPSGSGATTIPASGLGTSSAIPMTDGSSYGLSGGPDGPPNVQVVPPPPPFPPVPEPPPIDLIPPPPPIVPDIAPPIPETMPVFPPVVPADPYADLTGVSMSMPMDSMSIDPMAGQAYPPDILPPQPFVADPMVPDQSNFPLYDPSAMGGSGFQGYEQPAIIEPQPNMQDAPEMDPMIPQTDPNLASNASSGFNTGPFIPMGGDQAASAATAGTGLLAAVAAHANPMFHSAVQNGAEWIGKRAYKGQYEKYVDGRTQPVTRSADVNSPNTGGFLSPKDSTIRRSSSFSSRKSESKDYLSPAEQPIRRSSSFTTRKAKALEGAAAKVFMKLAAATSPDEPVRPTDCLPPPGRLIRATALYNWSGGRDGFLSLARGDIIHVIDPSEGSSTWWTGWNGAQTGRFPSEAVRITDRATAIFSFDAEEENELNFRAGDIIEVLKRTESRDDWWIGRNGRVMGVFPGSYVEDIA